MVDKFIEGLFGVKNDQHRRTKPILFVLVEDKNFALFNYVNELNNQIETLQEQISDIKQEIQRFDSQGVELEGQRERERERIEEKNSRVKRSGDEYAEKTEATHKTLKQCSDGSLNFFLFFLRHVETFFVLFFFFVRNRFIV